MLKTRVGVLRGGPSSEHDISFKTGANVLKNLSEKYQPVDIFIDKSGTWHVHGIASTPEKIFKKVDVLFNALHGDYGEDGGIQHLLDTFKIPYTGSGRLSSAFAMHKGHTKKLLKAHGIKSPYHKIVHKDQVTKETIHDLFRSIPHPSVVKPVSKGSSLGVSVVLGFLDFEEALQKAFTLGPAVMIEEYISGREATCGVLEAFRDESLYAFFPAEVVLDPSQKFFNFDAKYGGKSRIVHPGRFSRLEMETIKNFSRIAHQVLGLRHYSRSDFIVHSSRGVYFLETNSLPGLSVNAPYVESLSSVGTPFSHFIDHVLKLALDGK